MNDDDALDFAQPLPTRREREDRARDRVERFDATGRGGSRRRGGRGGRNDGAEEGGDVIEAHRVHERDEASNELGEWCLGKGCGKMDCHETIIARTAELSTALQ